MKNITNIGIKQEEIERHLTNNKLATRQDKLYKKGIVYLIFDTTNNQGYTGKTKKHFNGRYSGGKWWNYYIKKQQGYLYHRIKDNNDYHNFKIFILEHNIQDIKMLKERERFWAKVLNTYYPNGYNSFLCGGGEFYGTPSQITIEKRRRKTLKHYKIKEIKTGKIIDIVDLPNWCKENNLKIQLIRYVLLKISYISQGYCHPDTPQERIDIPYRCKKYTVIRLKDNQIIQIKYLKRFCEENQIYYQSFLEMLSGHTMQSYGYCLPTTNREEAKLRPNNKEIVLIDPNGQTIITNEIKKFSKENKLNYPHLFEVWKGKRNHHKGWKVLKWGDLDIEKHRVNKPTKFIRSINEKR